MLNEEQIKEFIADVSNKKGMALAKALEKYEDETVFTHKRGMNERKTIYRPQKQQVINIIKELAVENPGLSLIELIQKQAPESLNSLIKEQMSIVGELEKYISANLKDDELKNTQLIIEEFKKQINGESEIQFKRKSFINALNNVSSDTVKQEEITRIISKLPTSDTRIDSFFVKYSQDGRSSKEIASKFVRQSIPTAEHLIPKSKGGKNNTDNYLCDCGDCNSRRGNILFDEWMKQKPNMQKNIQFHLQEIQRALDNGSLPVEYNTYIEEIIQTIDKLSNGQVKLTAPKIHNDMQQNALLQKRKNEVDKLNKKLSELYAKRKSLRRIIKNLETNPKFKNLANLENLSQEEKEKLESSIKRTMLEFETEEELYNKMKAMDNKIQNLEDSISDERYILQLLDDIIQDNIQAQNENKKLNPFEIEFDRTKYEKYKKYIIAHQRQSEMMLEQKDKSKNVEALKTSCELMEEIVFDMSDKDDIKYYSNLDLIEESKEEINLIKERLKEIETIKQEIAQLQKEMLELSNNRTLREVQTKYKNLNQQIKTIEQIKNISELKTELKILEDTISYNTEILQQLKHYKTMPSEEFARLLNSIY